MILAVCQCWIDLFMPKKETLEWRRSIVKLNSKTLTAGTLLLVALMPWIRSGSVSYGRNWPALLSSMYGLEAIFCLTLKSFHSKSIVRAQEYWENAILTAAFRRGLV